MVRFLALLVGAVAVAVVAASETKTVKWWIPEDIKTKGYKASVVSIDGKDTTLAMNKDSTTGIIASGPSTLTAAITIETDNAVNYQEYHCELDPDKDQASCTHQISMSHSGNIIQDISDITIEGYQKTMAPIIVTAGADKLGDEENTTAADKSSAADEASVTDTSSATAVLKPKASEAETTSSGNAAPMMTQNAVFAGVAAVVGGAVVLL